MAEKVSALFRAGRQSVVGQSEPFNEFSVEMVQTRVHSRPAGLDEECRCTVAICDSRGQSGLPNARRRDYPYVASVMATRKSIETVKEPVATDKSSCCIGHVTAT